MYEMSQCIPKSPLLHLSPVEFELPQSIVPGYSDDFDVSIFGHAPTLTVAIPTSSKKPSKPGFKWSSMASKIMSSMGYIEGTTLGPLATSLPEQEIPVDTGKTTSIDVIELTTPTLFLELQSTKSFKKGAPVPEFKTFDSFNVETEGEVASNVPKLNENSLLPLINNLEISLFQDATSYENELRKLSAKLLEIEHLNVSKNEQLEVLSNELNQLNVFLTHFVALKSKLTLIPDFLSQFSDVCSFLDFTTIDCIDVFYKHNLGLEIFPLIINICNNLYLNWNPLIDPKFGLDQISRIFDLFIDKVDDFLSDEVLSTYKQSYNELFRPNILPKLLLICRNCSYSTLNEVVTVLNYWKQIFPPILFDSVISALILKSNELIETISFDFVSIITVLTCIKDILESSFVEVSRKAVELLLTKSRNSELATNILVQYFEFIKFKSILNGQQWRLIVVKLLSPLIELYSAELDLGLINNSSYLNGIIFYCSLESQLASIFSSTVMNRLIDYSKILAQNFNSSQDVSVIFHWFSFWKTKISNLSEYDFIKQQWKSVLVTLIASIGDIPS
ncbi:hypothetical protein RCL1_004371 [Eukaryota sp. TZLM3-RCL]